MLTAREILERVNSHLESLRCDRRPAGLYAPVEYVMTMGGKRIRPCLALMAYNMFRDDVERALPAACALETYHNFTLLHDDLMDNADMRRGKPTVHVRWDANTAILSGDTMLVLAFRRLCGCDPGILDRAMALFTETALEIGEGQQYDMEFETRMDVGEDEYIEMIRLKTSVLLACALKMGALLAGAPEGDQEALYRYGEMVGLAFQLQDDYLDVYGDPKVFGKPIGGDILCNKKTYMLINALALAGEGDRRELLSWISATDFDPGEKIAAVTAIYDRVGIDRLALDKIGWYFGQSGRFLDAVDVPGERKAVLRAYVEAMVGRKS